ILLFTLPALTQEKAGKKDTTQHLTVNSYRCPTHPNFIADKPGKCPKCGMDLRHLSAKEQMKRNVTKTYVCPADVTVISTQPGKCPKCAKYMQLSPKEKMKAEVVKLY